MGAMKNINPMRYKNGDISELTTVRLYWKIAYDKGKDYVEKYI